MSADASRHEYETKFYDSMKVGSLRSARVITPMLVAWLSPKSLLDVGCGAGAWCKIWKEQVPEVIGVDGDYVQKESLLIPSEEFIQGDLSKPIDLGRKFDLVTSLEVAEHVAAEHADVFVENLARHGDTILFSAAVPGQGGEFHVNEQPLSYWREKFEALGYRCFDPVRSAILDRSEVEPWYRYNTLLYVRGDALTMLPEAVRGYALSSTDEIPNVAPFIWRARNAIIRNLPEPIVGVLVSAKHSAFRRFRRDDAPS